MNYHPIDYDGSNEQHLAFRVFANELVFKPTTTDIERNINLEAADIINILLNEVEKRNEPFRNLPA